MTAAGVTLIPVSRGTVHSQKVVGVEELEEEEEEEVVVVVVVVQRLVTGAPLPLLLPTMAGRQ